MNKPRKKQTWSRLVNPATIHLTDKLVPAYKLKITVYAFNSALYVCFCIQMEREICLESQRDSAWGSEPYRSSIIIPFPTRGLLLQLIHLGMKRKSIVYEWRRVDVWGAVRNISKVPVVYITESLELQTSDSSLRYSTRNTLSYYFEVRRSKYIYNSRIIYNPRLYSLYTQTEGDKIW